MDNMRIANNLKELTEIDRSLCLDTVGVAGSIPVEPTIKIIQKKPKSPIKREVFRGLPPDTLPYLVMPKNTLNSESRGKRGVNGSRPYRQKTKKQTSR